MAASRIPSTWAELQSLAEYHVRHVQYSLGGSSRNGTITTLLRRYILHVRTLLVLFWIWLLYWGEVRVFEQQVSKCAWNKWEKWNPSATPHHVAFVADPQLIDPHTYPGRPWPLSTLTIAFTDKYLKRSYRKINQRLDPDTLYFLGDLFDGGREWNTDNPDFQTSDPRWARYGRKYWYDEYKRFANIFLAHDQVSGGRPYRRDKEIVLSLPGNHDHGFAAGVQFSVRSRFKAYFAQSDRVDIIGNHSFVGIDSVSLSAIDVKAAHEHIWRPTADFLDIAQLAKREATEHHIGRSKEYPDGRRFSHDVRDPIDRVLLSEPHKTTQKIQPGDLPTVLLTHVPLNRDSRAGCGPLRENHPPTDPNNLERQPDERNSIKIAAGYQYQNVLSMDLSRLVTTKIGKISHVFSGDDHDYCELVHKAYPSAGQGIREITVKSISWAMGVRKPGIVLASLYNPIDDNADPMPGSPLALKRPTLQTHLCLLPTQIDIFITYGIYLGLTIALLIASTIIAVQQDLGTPSVPQSPLLPTILKDKLRGRREDSRPRAASGAFRHDGNGYLATRVSNTRSRPNAASRSGDGYSPSGDDAADVAIESPAESRKGLEATWMQDVDLDTKPTARKRQRLALRLARSLLDSMLWVGVPGLLWFLVLWHRH